MIWLVLLFLLIRMWSTILTCMACPSVLLLGVALTSDRHTVAVEAPSVSVYRGLLMLTFEAIRLVGHDPPRLLPRHRLVFVHPALLVRQHGEAALRVLRALAPLLSARGYLWPAADGALRVGHSTRFSV